MSVGHIMSQHTQLREIAEILWDAFTERTTDLIEGTFQTTKPQSPSKGPHHSSLFASESMQGEIENTGMLLKHSASKGCVQSQPPTFCGFLSLVLF